MTTSLNDFWREFDATLATERSPSVVECLGRINIPGHVLDGCPAQLVELVASKVDGVCRHEAVVRLLEKRSIFKMDDEVTVNADAGEWKEA